ncbi:uncharacterized protein LOC128387618 [Panonychus citri]|uniref:uncharacterized protein LOC128387618 n=1 Tax=Panonychus citri TaxID=50023 RepID=UPI00230778D3|nr:uncharacterized protein LOC128387618 [Panonychus citri]
MLTANYNIVLAIFYYLTSNCSANQFKWIPRLPNDQPLTPLTSSSYLQFSSPSFSSTPSVTLSSYNQLFGYNFETRKHNYDKNAHFNSVASAYKQQQQQQQQQLPSTIFGTTKIEPPSRPLSAWDDPSFKPYFDDHNVDNVTTQLGKTAYLHCKIRQLGDRTVSWVRQKDLHILTVGRYTYTSDQRFTCVHLDDSDDWTLEIKYIQKDDAGIYECQVSTEPKMSLSIKLGVVAAKAIIPEGSELIVEVGVTVNLTCIISEQLLSTLSSPSSSSSFSSPVYVFWYHEGTVINYDSPRGGAIKVITDRSSSIVSRLTIIEARIEDSGEYSCKPSYADFANITLHVIQSSVSSSSTSNTFDNHDKNSFNDKSNYHLSSGSSCLYKINSTNNYVIKLTNLIYWFSLLFFTQMKNK